MLLLVRTLLVKLSLLSSSEIVRYLKVYWLAALTVPWSSVITGSGIEKVDTFGSAFFLPQIVKCLDSRFKQKQQFSKVFGQGVLPLVPSRKASKREVSDYRDTEDGLCQRSI